MKRRAEAVDRVCARCRRSAGALVAILLPVSGAACKDKPRPAPPPPKVSVSRPVQREIMEWDEYTARFEATEVVEVRARVSGYLESIHFKDGSIVKKGELLFTIDPRPYQAAQRRAEGELAVFKARLDLAQQKAERVANLIGREAISKEEGEIRSAEARAAEASLTAAAAAVESAKLDVEFTEIHSPIHGRVGRRLVTEGNLVNGGLGPLGTLLTTIVSLDPMYAYFDADERSYLKYFRLAKSGARPSSRDYKNPVHIGLADEQGFPHEGQMDFVDNQLDRGTGTIVGRALVPNPDLIFTPGLFARLQLPGSGKYQAILLPDAAILFDLSVSFVWVLDGQNRVEYRPVQVGRLYEGLRIIKSGLGPGDRVIVAGVQGVWPGIEVQPEEAPIQAGAPGLPAAQKSEAAPAGPAKGKGGEGEKE